MRIFLLLLAVAVGACRQNQTPEQLAAQQNAADDATCKSYGLQFSTPAYADCRLRLQQMRQEQQAQNAAQADAALLQWQQSMAANRPVVTNCTTTGGNQGYGNGPPVTTNCVSH
jgi:hypothetical protein